MEYETAVRRVTEAETRRRIARTILEALPDWFGIRESREEYINASGTWTFFAAYRQGSPAGFLCLKETGKATAELAVMGVLSEYHRQGIGRALFEAAREEAVRRGYQFLQVKTVAMGYYETYDRTNRFYQSMGFQEFEVFPELWDRANPCQVYVMGLAGALGKETYDPDQAEAGNDPFPSERIPGGWDGCDRGISPSAGRDLPVSGIRF